MSSIRAFASLWANVENKMCKIAPPGPWLDFFWFDPRSVLTGVERLWSAVCCSVLVGAFLDVDRLASRGSLVRRKALSCSMHGVTQKRKSKQPEGIAQRRCFPQ